MTVFFEDEGDQPTPDVLGPRATQVWALLRLPEQMRPSVLEMINLALEKYLNGIHEQRMTPITERAQLMAVRAAAKALLSTIDNMDAALKQGLWLELDIGGAMLLAGLNELPGKVDEMLAVMPAGKTGRPRAPYWALAETLGRLWLMNKQHRIDQSGKRGSFRHFAETVCDALPADMRPNWAEVTRRAHKA